jgi:hypothetical protein
MRVPRGGAGLRASLVAAFRRVLHSGATLVRPERTRRGDVGGGDHKRKFPTAVPSR